MRKLLLISILSFVLSIVLASIFDVKPENNTLLNTLFTVASIMFSIGMGIICTFNPGKIKNKNIYLAVKNNILLVRNNFLLYFGIVSAFYLLSQLYDLVYIIPIAEKIAFTFNLLFLSISMIAISIIYFIFNFLAIQKLNFEISEKTNY